jgi:tetratricopeptide (TPR) repeat protein
VKACRALLALAGILVLAAGAGLGAAPARAQRTGAPNDPERPLLMRLSPRVPAASRGVAPLDPAQMQVVRDALMSRQAGRLTEARAKLAALPPAAQRHPIVLTELARLDLAEGKLDQVVRTAVYERRAQRDSLLLGEELTEAYERLGRAREASQTATEVWACSPVEESWAIGVLVRLAPADGHAGRDGLRRALAREPQRGDLARGLARLEWQGGDMRAALKALAATERAERGPNARWAFGETLLLQATARDTTGATEAFLDVAADVSLDAAYRLSAARRYWVLQGLRDAQASAATRLYQAMKDLPPDRWGADLSLQVARALRQSGDTGASRALLHVPPGRTAEPDVALERSLADLRDGPPERALDELHPGPGASEEQQFHYAEALFYAGQVDSALAWYQRVSTNPSGEHTGEALERVFMLEDGQPRAALPVLGRIAYEQWRGSGKRAGALAESLWAALPRGPLWAQTAMIVSQQRESGGDVHGALAAVLAVADSLPDDRLAPLARQRAGDLYATRLHDEARAIEQYEACVARYPRAWNAPEARRRLEELRRSRRF